MRTLINRLSMASAFVMLIAVLNIFPAQNFFAPETAEASSVSAYTRTGGELREGGEMKIFVSATSSIKSIEAKASNKNVKIGRCCIRGQKKGHVHVTGKDAGSTYVTVKVRLKNGHSYKKTVSLRVYDLHKYDYMYKCIRDEGFSKNEALGIMANLMWETGPVNTYNRGSFSLATLSRYFVDPGNHCGSYYGMFQLCGSRKSAMMSYCSRNGYSYSSVKGQIKFMAYEMRHSESYAKKMLKSADSASEAGYLFASYYERCATRYRAPRGTTARRLDLFY